MVQLIYDTTLSRGGGTFWGWANDAFKCGRIRGVAFSFRGAYFLGYYEYRFAPRDVCVTMY